MATRKKKTKGSKESPSKSKRETEAGEASATEIQRRAPQVAVEEIPLGGETVLAVGGEQPLLSRESGESWDFQADPQVREVLEETEKQANGGQQMADALELHNSESPILSGGDVDAAWDNAEEGGEEAVGGTVATPDQDRVDELGEAVGLVYQDQEPLNTEEKLEKRDRERWELNSASQD